MFRFIKKASVVAMTFFGCNVLNVNRWNVFEWIIESVK